MSLRYVLRNLFRSKFITRILDRSINFDKRPRSVGVRTIRELELSIGPLFYGTCCS